MLEKLSGWEKGVGARPPTGGMDSGAFEKFPGATS